MQRYLDIAMPLRAAGAYTDDKGRWYTPDGRMGVSARAIADRMGVEPIEVPPPPSRTMSQIRRESLRLAGARPAAPGKFVRALQYAMHIVDGDAPHSANLWSAEKHCRTDFVDLPDGRRESRVRSVDGWEIPNWDFVARDPIEADSVFA